VRKRAATKGDVVVDVKPGEEVISVNVNWTVEKFVALSQSGHGNGRANGKSPSPNGKSPKAKMEAPKKTTPAKKATSSPKRKVPAKKPAAKSKTPKKKGKK
jgi:hypothetical protein